LAASFWSKNAKRSVVRMLWPILLLNRPLTQAVLH
jgi:hypothetical protein